VANIEEIFESFKELARKFFGHFTKLEEEILILKEEVYTLQKKSHDVLMIGQGHHGQMGELDKTLKLSKNMILKLAEKGEEIEKDVESLHSLLQLSSETGMGQVTHNRNHIKKLKDFLGILESIKVAKDEIKDVGQKSENKRYRLNQLMDQMIVLTRSKGAIPAQGGDKYEQFIQSVKEELKGIDGPITQVSKLLMNLEVKANKMLFLIGEGELEKVEKETTQAELELKDIIQVTGRMRNLIQDKFKEEILLEEGLVGEFHRMGENNRKCRAFLGHVEDIVRQNHREVLDQGSV